jgi:hypothetical protein
MQYLALGIAVLAAGGLGYLFRQFRLMDEQLGVQYEALRDHAATIRELRETVDDLLSMGQPTQPSKGVAAGTKGKLSPRT